MKPSAAPRSPRSNKPVLAIDFDDVLFEHDTILRTYFRKKYGLAYDPRTDYDLLSPTEGKTGLDRELIVSDAERFLLGPEHRAVTLQGAADVLRKLSQEYSLAIVTSRSSFIKTQTYEWLEKHYPDIFETVVFAGKTRWGFGPKVAKIPELHQLNTATLIDDSLRHCIEASAEGMRAILFGDYLWNQAAELPSGVTRAKDWSEVEKILLP